MTEPLSGLSNLAREWTALGEALGFRVVAPADVEFAPGRWVHADVLLPDFGAPRGMLLVTDFARIRAFADDALSAGYGFSTLSEPHTLELRREDLDSVIDVLEDWGWAGDPADEPEWLRRPPLSTPSNLGHEWIALGDALGFQVIAPAQVRLGPRVVEVEVLLPDFGASCGMLLVTDDSRIEEWSDGLLTKGYALATLTDPGRLELTPEKLTSTVRLLQDWGWAGVLSDTPEWMGAEAGRAQ